MGLPMGHGIIDRLFNGINQSIDYVIRLINGWGPGRGPGEGQPHQHQYFDE